jgi:hypothetical protein
MAEVAATEDVKMTSVPAAEVSSVAKEGGGDVAMGDGDDHEKMMKAARQSEQHRSFVSSIDSDFLGYHLSRILLCRLQPSI